MRKILIVEDDKDIREALEELFSEAGAEVRSAGDGQRALRLLAAERELPQVILLDLMMPVMDGTSFRGHQLADPRIASIPVVLMSADRQLEEKRGELGAIGALRKPLDIDEVLRTVWRF